MNDEPAWREFPVIETPRLRLGRLGTGDAPEIHRMFTSDAWLRFIPREAVSRPADAIEKACRMTVAFDNHVGIWWSFRMLDTAEFVGYGGLFDLNHEDRKAEIGYGFHPDSWGRGLATEAVAPIVDFGFSRLGLHRIYGLVDPRNGASTRVLEKLGFSLEGTLRESAYARGQYWDQCILGKISG